MVAYRAYVGDTHGEWSHLDAGGLDWSAARDLLMARAFPMTSDDCLDCRMQAAEAYEDLRLLAEGDVAEWWVDGELYRLSREGDGS
jgi:hypothetical protein